MASFDEAAYKKDVIVPLARAQARALQQALAEMKDPAAKRPSAFDLLFLYQITSRMSDADIAERLHQVKVCWNNEFVKTKDPKRKSAANFVRQLHELLEKRNPDLPTQKWWAESVEEKQKAKLALIAKLAEMLRHSPYAALKHITADRLTLVAANDPSFSSFDEDDLRAAANDAGLTLVWKVDLPSGQAKTSLVSDLNRAGDPTLVHAAFFNDRPSSYSILSDSDGGRPYVLKAGSRAFNEDTLLRAQQANSASGADEATARDKVLSALRGALASGVDLHELVVQHLVDEAKGRCQGGLLQSAYQYLVDTGLSPTDAARIVLSLDPAIDTRPSVTADAVRALLGDGSLGAADEALRQLSATVSDDEQKKKDVEALRASLTAQRAKVEQLRLAAADAIRSSDIRTARAALLDAVRLDRDNEDLARDFASLPPEPPYNATAAVQSSEDPANTQVRLSWQAGLGSDDETRYRVVRKVGAAPESVDDGTTFDTTAATSFVDAAPEFVNETYYGVFATRGKAYSRPTVTAITVVPGVGKLTLSATPTGVGGHWMNPARANDITVVQIGPDGTRSGIPLSSPCSFVSDGLVQGARYRYEVTAHYRSNSGAPISSEPVVREAIPRAQAQPVPSLTVKPLITQDGACQVRAQWSRQPAHEVQLWCFPQPPLWSYGSRINANTLSSKGNQLFGQGVDANSVTTLTADVPSGLLHYLAVTVDGDHRVIGQSDQLGICDPVDNPRVERFGDEAVLSWDWPAVDYSVRAIWSGPSTSGQATISKSRYDTSGGMRIRVGSGRSEIRLSTFIDHADGEWQSPTKTVTVDSASTTVKYQIAWNRKLFGGASGFVVTAVSDSDVNGPELVIGYRADRVMPNSMRQIQEIQRHSLQLQAGGSVDYSVSLPKMPKHYWVRCFLDAAESTRLVDPPTDDLRGR